MALAAAVLVCLVATGGSLALAVRARQPQAQPTPALVGTGSISALTRALQVRGHQCSRSPLVPSPQIWMCFRDVTPLEEYVVAQSSGGDRLDVIVIRLDQLDFSRTVKPSRQQALEFFKAVVGDAFPASTARQIQTWTDGVAGTQTAAATVAGDQVSESTSSGAAELEVDVGQAMREYTAFNDVAMPNVTQEAARTYLEGRGLACRPDQGFVYCELDQPTLYADAGIQLNQAAPTVWMLDLLVHALSTNHDVGEQLGQWFPDLERLVFRGDDARRVASWISSHLEKRWHRMIIDGIQVTMYPFRPSDWAVKGIWGMRLQIEVAKWP
jgi:hypothetical protein